MIIQFKKAEKTRGLYLEWGMRDEGWGRGSVFSSHVGLIGNFLIAHPPKKVYRSKLYLYRTFLYTRIYYIFYPSHCIQSAIDFLTHNLIYSYTEQCTCAQSYHHRYIILTHIYVTLCTSSPLLKTGNYLFK